MRKLIIGGGLLIAVGLALTALVNWSRPDRITLPDGRILEVRAITYGTNHMVPGQYLQRFDKQLPTLAARVLRKWWPAAARPVEFTSFGSQSSLMVWFRRVGESRTNRAPIHLVAQVAGINISPAGLMRWPESGPAIPQAPEMPTLILFNFPRTQESLTLLLSVANPETHVHEAVRRPFRVRNPHPYRGPEFRAASLPSAATHRNVRAELMDLVVIHTPYPTPQNPGHESMEIQFTLKTDTETHRPATISDASICDAGGNRLRDLPQDAYRPFGGLGQITFGSGCSLGSLESVFHLHLEALPEATSKNSETAEFTVGPDDSLNSASAPGNSLPFRSRLIPGLEIQRVAVDNSGLETFFSCFADGPTTDAQISLVSIKDSRGRPVRFSGNQRAINDSSRFPNVWKTWRADSTADRDRKPPYTLTFQILPFSHFEFSVAPRHITNSPPFSN